VEILTPKFKVERWEN